MTSPRYSEPEFTDVSAADLRDAYAKLREARIALKTAGWLIDDRVIVEQIATFVVNDLEHAMWRVETALRSRPDNG